MEQNFQTSFIPKKPIVQERTVKSRRPTGILLVLSVFVFLSMIASAAGVYFYKNIVAKNIADMERNLNIAKNRFEPSKITQLQVLDKRLRASKEILGKHIAVSPIFKALSEITMKSVRYTKFSYDVGTSKEAKIIIKLRGQALKYSSIALQSDLFKKNTNLIDPVFSNLALDDKGNVLFDLEFAVDPRFVAYKSTVEAEIAALQESATFIPAAPEANPQINSGINNPFLSQ